MLAAGEPAGVLDVGEEEVEGACAVLDPELPEQPTYPVTNTLSQTKCQRRRIRDLPIHDGDVAE